MVRVALRNDRGGLGSSRISSFARDIEPHIVVEIRTRQGGHHLARIGAENDEGWRLGRVARVLNDFEVTGAPVFFGRLGLLT